MGQRRLLVLDRDRVQQAHDASLADVGELDAVVLQGRGSAQSRGRQRHLAVAVRLSDQRAVLLRLGLRFATTWGGDLRAQGGGSSARLRPDGTIVNRNDFVGMPLHRVDLRLRRQFRVGPKLRAAALVELFNIFNHANYGGYSTAQSLANFGQPTSVANAAYYPREVQLGFRFTF